MGTRLLHCLSEFCVSVIALAFLGLSLAGCLGLQVPSVHYYVSPTGSDSNPGTISQPFRTIDHARLMVQSVNKHTSEDIFVSLRGGTYPLSQTLAFGPGDSGTTSSMRLMQARSPSSAGDRRSRAGPCMTTTKTSGNRPSGRSSKRGNCTSTVCALSVLVPAVGYLGASPKPRLAIRRPIPRCSAGATPAPSNSSTRARVPIQALPGSSRAVGWPVSQGRPV